MFGGYLESLGGLGKDDLRSRLGSPEDFRDPNERTPAALRERFSLEKLPSFLEVLGGKSIKSLKNSSTYENVENDFKNYAANMVGQIPPPLFGLKTMSIGNVMLMVAVFEICRNVVGLELGLAGIIPSNIHFTPEDEDDFQVVCDAVFNHAPDDLLSEGNSVGASYDKETGEVKNLDDISEMTYRDALTGGIPNPEREAEVPLGSGPIAHTGIAIHEQLLISLFFYEDFSLERMETEPELFQKLIQNHLVKLITAISNLNVRNVKDTW